MKSIGSKILMVALLNILLAGLLIGSVSIYTFSTNSKAQIAQTEKLLLVDYDLTIKSATESLITSLKPIENAIESGELEKAEEDLQLLQNRLENWQRTLLTVRQKSRMLLRNSLIIQGILLKR